MIHLHIVKRSPAGWRPVIKIDCYDDVPPEQRADPRGLARVVNEIDGWKLPRPTAGLAAAYVATLSPSVYFTREASWWRSRSSFSRTELAISFASGPSPWGRVIFVHETRQRARDGRPALEFLQQLAIGGIVGTEGYEPLGPFQCFVVASLFLVQERQGQREVG